MLVRITQLIPLYPHIALNILFLLMTNRFKLNHEGMDYVLAIPDNVSSVYNPANYMFLIKLHKQTKMQNSKTLEGRITTKLNADDQTHAASQRCR